MVLNPCRAEYFMYPTPPQSCKLPSCRHVFSVRVENSVDPDQLASSVTKPADLDLHCFQKNINPKNINPGSAGQD